MVSLMAPSAAFAEPPVDLAGAYVLDRSNVVGPREGEIKDAIDGLYQATGLQLFVVYVDSFSGVANPQDWATETATKNGFGANDILLAVATKDRIYSVSYANDSPLTVEQRQRVEEQNIVPALRNDDWAGAVVAAATGYEGAVNGSGGANPFTAILFVLFVIVAIVVIIVLVRARRKRGGAKAVAPPNQLTQEQLDQRAGSLLVQLDDSLKTSEQELDFAIAQFGTEATTPFSAALATAKTQVAEAFRIRQKLDDAVPETPEEKRAMTVQVIELCDAADKALDEQADAFDDLRALERTAPQALVALAADVDAVNARLAAARQTLVRLLASYSASAVSSVAQNPEQTEQLLAFIGTARSAAVAAIKKGDSGAAAINVRAAQASVPSRISCSTRSIRSRRISPK